MGTRLAVTVEGASHEAAVAGSEAALRAVEHVDGVLSTWRTGTALGAVNAAPVGAAVSVPPELVSWMELAARWSRNTDRAFDPVIGSLVDAWDLRGEGRVPDPAALAQAVRQTGFRTLRLNARAGTITRLSAATWIDPGGFGKGVALGAALDSLRARGIRSAFLNFGGQVAALGLDHGRPWRVPIAHPDHRDRPVLSLALTDGSAATSGQSERYVLAGVGDMAMSSIPAPASRSVPGAASR